VTLDQWRARYEELDAEAARLRTERNAARAEAAKLQSLIDLQQTRMDAANTLWQDAHPEKEHLCPDLGDLLAWLIEERAVLKTFRQLDRAALAHAQAEAARAVEALRKLSEQVAISAKDSFGTCEEWLDSYRLEAPDECAAYEKAVAVLSWSDPALIWLAQQRREAAAEELEKADSDIRQYATQHEYGTGQAWTVSDAAQYCFDMAAALRAGKGVGDAE
jgi:hypothetical protein